ncbi:choice-of-anchor I family protein [Corynebacterium mendelii]|uniref:Choice-of-anchor I family protein n=1 Tax=Corynebacterium mendelii TaxID=2765362 RepID=A0A939DXP2_9CORY|nr:choice-of-anchor I family protein [Corynebacterium mendelii]MBN9643134.1 choice-of-anchor I family protein [Corynebacterium mendelii]
MSPRNRSRTRLVAAVTALGVTVATTAAAPQATADSAAYPITVNAAGGSDVTMVPFSTYDSGVTQQSAAEIAVYHPASKHALITNAQSATVDVVSLADPNKPVKLYSLAIGDGVDVNSVDVRADGLAVVVANPKGDAKATRKGKAYFFDGAADTDKGVLGSVELGYLPDMVKISPDGRFAVVANEGEPADDNSVDPEGSVSIITLADTVTAPGQDQVREVAFDAYNDNPPAGVRIRPGSTAAKDFEPEYVTISGGTAYVALQENNAIAVIDIDNAAVTKVFGLGYVDYREVKTDFSDKDETFELKNWPVKGLPMPDGITSFTKDGTTYIVTANEGDGREYGKKPNKYTDEQRVKKLDLCDDFADMSGEEIKALTQDTQLGRLKVLTDMGRDADRDCYSELYAFGGRGFSIYNASTGERVFNSGSEFAEVIAKNGDLATMLDGWRSDDKLSEPEAAEVARVGDRTFALIGLERASGVMVYDITDPAEASFQTFVANFDPTKDVDDPGAGDFSPESVHFIPAKLSPTGADMVMVANEWSGTTTFYSFKVSGTAPAPEPEPGTTTPGTTPDDTTPSTTGQGSSKDTRTDKSGSATTGGIIIAVAAVLAAIAALVPHLAPTLLSGLPRLPLALGWPPMK